MHCAFNQSLVEQSLVSWKEKGQRHRQPLRQLKTQQSVFLAYQVMLFVGCLNIALSACSIEEDVKYAGHNLYPAKGKTQAECAALCLHEPECNYWTYNANARKCWLKKSDKGRAPSTKGSNSGQKSCGVTG